ncbi:MAG: hypothetical protein COX77_04460 [Candidatus Komeilibacteria bacterium CG_4_10_14_0_2_um_filter_37_10]|uniref:Uncharacterized protein n=1 Tax=Candidatus Komeilibacteria bacterium CG_4_10_14_0_2_um_filter_37_10 TaxID=1974470 RepID=A0A2M7VDG9_9BACT|nr:MAG: hypothetical protein COX77_04460 [Candidatus Komeilibacteria bacterium CG_4_10_14_0_2_um_filter_37_10]PJA92622.1 MAG: hypothetical protein CO133_02190 [Candidatus Komeilibacteria bacterium CG_4_9_14_3_um_filter_37_5]
MKPILLLTEKQVPVGIKVVVYLEGEEEPKMGDDGKLMIFRVLWGGIPVEKRFYPEELIRMIPVRHESVDGKKENTVNCMQLMSVANFKPQIRFAPTQTFTLTDVPANTTFLVFVDGDILQYPGGQSSVKIRTDEQRHMLSDDRGYEYKYFGKEYPIPPNAILVPTCNVGEHIAK